MNRPIPYPKKVINSTLNLQYEPGLWDSNVSYCIDLDAILSLLRRENQPNGYRKEDTTHAAIKYLDYTIPTLNDKDSPFNHYVSAHKLTGCLGAIAEIYKFMPMLFDSSIKFNQSLDITPWI
ncbi:MAG: hypothetical protein P8Y23_11110 [Candidatus Lokiarchaeota archaeon]|jgi:hypothetical protein